MSNHKKEINVQSTRVIAAEQRVFGCNEMLKSDIRAVISGVESLKKDYKSIYAELYFDAIIAQIKEIESMHADLQKKQKYFFDELLRKYRDQENQILDDAEG